MLNKEDINILRKLARSTAEVAALPIQEEKRNMWRMKNALKPVRPMVMIDDVCWNELYSDQDLQLQCEDPECREYEDRFRRTLYQWNHFRVDMVVDPVVKVNKAIHNTGFAVTVNEETAEGDPTSHTKGHLYINQFETDEDLEKIKVPHATHDEAETLRRLDVAHEIFDGILEVKPWGFYPYLGLWDRIATWMSVEDALFAMIDRPEYIHKLLEKMTNGYLKLIDQLEAENLLSGTQSIIHCSGAYTDELPVAGYNPDKPRAKDMWMFGLAQMLSSVSPDMFSEFEVEYTKRICDRFGLVYYGCCDPLDHKMEQVRMIPNVRKISMSAWANEERGAKEIGSDFVYSRKPNPAPLATDCTYDILSIKKDLENTRDLCERNGCPLEFILKDLSTVNYKPERLDEWAKVAMKVVNG